MAVDDVCILRIIGRYQSQNIVNTLHWRITSQTLGDNFILDSMLTAWAATWQSDWLNRHIASYSLVGTKAFRKTGAPKTPAFAPVGLPGAVVGEELPSTVCRTITLYSDSPKFRRRGRLMLSGTAVSMLNTDDGAVTSAEIIALAGLQSLCLEAMVNGDDSWELCLPATLVDPVVNVIDAIARSTPASITTRRIRQFLVG